MKVEITSFKDTGKWYDHFYTEVSNNTPCWNVNAIQQEIEFKHPQLKQFDYVFRIDDEKNWQWRLITNTKKL